ncbi:hypothetical protein BH10CHL1_BH10CHL1_04810 [soil metagenome]
MNLTTPAQQFRPRGWHVCFYLIKQAYFLRRLPLRLVLCSSLFGLMLTACSNQPGETSLAASQVTVSMADIYKMISPLVATTRYSAVLPANAATVESTLVSTDTVTYYETAVILPTYPYEQYQTDAIDPTYQWPYKKFDVERFRAEAPKPAMRTYKLLILENRYLKVTILPELGGRIWQVIHKPSGKPMFYQNAVVKPTHWGSPNQLGWLALGGLEWDLPVSEHGYDWGSAWNYTTAQPSDQLATVTLSTPQDGRYLNASITVSLRAGAASFEFEPTITNVSDHALNFSYWQDAVLAPGSGKKLNAQLHLVLPNDKMTIHSTFDPTLPQPGQPFTWPIYQGRDLSRLGNWQQYIGFFEAPTAHGPFVGVYDPITDAGVVRIYPSDVMQGSKVFGLGWADRLTSDNFTDDDSSYMELHGGLTATFSDTYRLSANNSVNWRETWYPVQGIGDLTFANELAAMTAQRSAAGVRVGFYPTRPITGDLVFLLDGKEQQRQAVQASPDAPFNQLFIQGPLPTGKISLEFQDSTKRPLLSYSLK